MDFWDRFAGVYDLAESINGSVYTEMRDITRRLIPAGAKVLDCGAGTGQWRFLRLNRFTESGFFGH